MINGSDLRDFYINAWRNIPELVAALLDEDPGSIRSHAGPAHIAKSLAREVLDMPDGTIFVAYQGFKPGTRRNEVTKHEIAAFIRALSLNDDANIPFGGLMIDGVPDGEELPVRLLDASEFIGGGANVDSMDMPTFERASATQLTIDIWHLWFTVPEYAT